MSDSIPVMSVPIENEEVLAFVLQFLHRTIPEFKPAFEQFVSQKRETILKQQQQVEETGVRWD